MRRAGALTKNYPEELLIFCKRNKRQGVAISGIMSGLGTNMKFFLTSFSVRHTSLQSLLTAILHFPAIVLKSTFLSKSDFKK